MFGMNKLFGADEIKVIPTEAKRVLANQQAASSVGVNATTQALADGMYSGGAKLASGETSAPKPTRPGDTPPRQFVGKTHDQIEATLNTYEDELASLNRDITKLEEERMQITRSINALRAAMNHLSGSFSPEEDEALYNSAVKATEVELSNAGTV